MARPQSTYHPLIFSMRCHIPAFHSDAAPLTQTDGSACNKPFGQKLEAVWLSPVVVTLYSAGCRARRQGFANLRSKTPEDYL